MASLSTEAAEATSSRLRAYGRIAGLILWFLACIVPHSIARLTGTSRWPRRFMRGAAAICGADVRCDGAEAMRGTLLVANHASWLDIPVLCTATGCAFVSKAELTTHPVMRWFADQNETIYVDRGARRDIHGQAAAITEGLRHDKPLALFPEGTVGDGVSLLPFKPSLLSAVSPPPEGIAVRPAAIDYGRLGPVIGWGTGEPGVANFLRVLGRRGRIPVTVHLLPALPPSPDRKQLAKLAHDAIAEALAPSGIRPAGV
jgi:lyso-ornithine lipid O-acyltransferase